MDPTDYTVGPETAGQRLDLYLKDRLPEGSRKAAKRLLDAGRVRVNGRKIIIASWQLKRGDKVAVVSESEPAADVSQFFLKVVFEDDAILVVDKDAGIPCEESAQSLKPSLVQIINAYLMKKGPPGARVYLGLLHRLDADTSGLMVYAKKKTANRLSAQFKDHSIERRYWALVQGQVDKEQGLIRTFLEKGSGLRKVRITAAGTGKKAETHFRVLERYRDATLVELRPTTGRTHQIRVHLAHIEHPLFGDRLYGRPDSDPLKCRRQALHATVLGFVHPVTNKKLKFQSDLPKDMRRLVDRLRRGVS